MVTFFPTKEMIPSSRHTFPADFLVNEPAVALAFTLSAGKPGTENREWIWNTRIYNGSVYRKK